MYRIFTSLVHPLSLGFLCALAALGWAWWRCPRERRPPLTALTIVLVLFGATCMPIVAHFALWSLERRYPPETPPPEKAGAIVVLAAGMNVLDEASEHCTLDAPGTARCLHAARLYRLLGPCLVIPSGGRVESDPASPTLAQAMAEFLIEQGVAESDILLEDASGTTYENAVQTAALVERHKLADVVLVTDAAHLGRAVACFRAAGVEVTPAPCNHRAGALRWSGRSLVPSAEAALRFHDAFHEWCGWVWYRLKGRV